MIDLHTHSYYSDGVYSPSDLVKKANQIGITILSLCDHNGIDGLDEFFSAANDLGLKAISGVEIYTCYKKKHLHILGHNFDIEDKALNKALKKLQKKHIPQVKQTIKALQADKWEITEKDVFDTPAVYIDPANIAGTLKKHPKNWERIKKDFNWHKGKIIPITQIIARYFYNSKNSYKTDSSIYSESEISIESAIKLIKQAGGKTVLAHPGECMSWHEDYLIKELKNIGLDGLEAISSHHSWQEIEHWQIAAKELDLEITVGSDFHGFVPDEWGFVIRSPWDYFGYSSACR